MTATYHPESGLILPFMGYPKDCFDLLQVDGGMRIERWDCPGAAPTPDAVLAQRKPYWAARKRREIDDETALRSQSIVGSASLPAGVLELIDGFISTVLQSSSKRSVSNWSQQWKDIAQLRAARNTLLGGVDPLSGLELWLADPDRSADAIRDFDVAGWSGWGIARPPAD